MKRSANNYLINRHHGEINQLQGIEIFSLAISTLCLHLPAVFVSLTYVSFKSPFGGFYHKPTQERSANVNFWFSGG